MSEHLGGELDQFIDLHLGRSSQRRPCRGRILQCSHSASADIAESLDGVETLRMPALSRQPGIDERIPELVRQRIRKQSWQSVKRQRPKRRKLIGPWRQGHGDGRELDAARDEGRIVLERGYPSPII